MKTYFIAISLFFLIVSLGCLNNSDPQDTTTTPTVVVPKCVGLWKTQLPFKAFTGYNVLLDLHIKPAPDTTYSLVGLSDSTHDTILAQVGLWTLNHNADTIFLNGTSCRIIDTAQKKLVARDCAAIKSNVNITNNEWTIPLTDLLPLAEQMKISIPVAYLPTLQTIPVILTKQ